MILPIARYFLSHPSNSPTGCDTPLGALFYTDISVRYPILQHIARYLCDTPGKQARRSFAIPSLKVSRDMRSIAAGPLSPRTVSEAIFTAAPLQALQKRELDAVLSAMLSRKGMRRFFLWGGGICKSMYTSNINNYVRRNLVLEYISKLRTSKITFDFALGIK